MGELKCYCQKCGEEMKNVVSRSHNCEEFICINADCGMILKRFFNGLEEWKTSSDFIEEEIKRYLKKQGKDNPIILD